MIANASITLQVSSSRRLMGGRQSVSHQVDGDSGVASVGAGGGPLGAVQIAKKAIFAAVGG